MKESKVKNEMDNRYKNIRQNLWRGLSRSNTPDSYPRGVRFEFRSGHRLTCVRLFVVFPQFLQENSGRVSQLGHGRSHPDHLQFIIHLSSNAI
jgi:hypothetical protein